METTSTPASTTKFTISTAASEKISELINSTDGNYEAIRVYVSGGGCSGMNYGMTFSNEVADDDYVITTGNDNKLIIDCIAFVFLENSEIDFADDGLSASFVFKNAFQSVGGSGTCGGCSGSH